MKQKFAALALALGIGIQNFPEGAAISLPLRQEGLSRLRSFLYGAASGVVEPVFGLLTVLAAGAVIFGLALLRETRPDYIPVYDTDEDELF